MSSVDKRVVQMVFDNDKFEKNIEQSRKSLENMDKTLDKVADNTSAERLGNTIGDSLEKGVDKGILKAEALRTVINTVMGSITTSVINAVHKMQSSINELTFDQINAGFGKYEEQLKSVNTIMNATRESLDVVEKHMQNLLWYTDETSYNFSDMASNIGKFTAVGVELETASSAMQGIANWAGLAGQNAQAASRAMYNISQAMSAGYMKQQDWASIQNASMDTQEFRKVVYNTAKEMAKAGKYTQLSLEWFDTNSANDFFADLGKNKNFTTDILIESLQKFSFYSDEIRRITEEENKTTIDAMDILGELTEENVKSLEKTYEEFGEGSKELKKEAEDLGISVASALNIAKAGWDTFDLGRRAFEASQEYKTFGDVIDATKDAVSSLWMQIDRQIFGNLEQAKEFWTEIGDIFNRVFAGPVEKILAILEAWNQFSGRDLLLGITETTKETKNVVSVFGEIYEMIHSITESIRMAFLEVFNGIATVRRTFKEDGVIEEWGISVEKIGSYLAYLTYLLKQRLAALNAWLNSTSENSKDGLTRLQKIAKIFKGLFKVIKGVGTVLYSIGKSFLTIVKAIFPSLDTILNALSGMDEAGDGVQKVLLDIANTIWYVSNRVAQVIKKLKEKIMDGTIFDYLVKLIGYLLGTAINAISKFVNKAIEYFQSLGNGTSKAGNKIFEVINSIATAIKSMITTIYNGFINSNIGKNVLGFLQNVWALLQNIVTFLSNALNFLGTLLNKALSYINNLFSGANGAMAAGGGEKTKKDSSTAVGALMTVLGFIIILMDDFIDAYKHGSTDKFFKSLTELFESLGEAVNAFSTKLKISAIKDIGFALVEVAIGAAILATIPIDSLKQVTLVLGGTLVVLVGALALVSRFGGGDDATKSMAKLLSSMRELGIALILITSVVLKLTKQKPEEIFDAVINLGEILLAVGAFIGVVRLSVQKFGSMTDKEYKQMVEGMEKVLKITVYMSIAIGILKSSIIAFSKIKEGGIEKALIGVVFVMIMLIGMCVTLVRTAKSISTITNFVDVMNKLSLALGLLTVAFFGMATMMLVASYIPTVLIIKGFMTMNGLIGTVNKMFKVLNKMLTGMTNAAAVMTAEKVLVLAAAMIVIAAGIGLLVPPMIVLGGIPIKRLTQGFGMLAATAALFISIIVILEWTTDKILDSNTAYASHVWQTVGAQLLMISAAIFLIAGAVWILVQAIDAYSKVTGDLNELALYLYGDMFATLLIIATFYAALKLIELIPGSTYGFEFGLEVLLLSLSISAVAAGLYALIKVVEYIHSLPYEVLFETAKILMQIAVAIGVVVAAIKRIKIIINRLNSINSGGTTTSSSVVMIGTEIFKLGAGLMLLATSVMMLVPIIALLGSDALDKTFDKGAERLGKLAAALLGFMVVLMIVYALMARISNGMAVGFRETNTTFNGTSTSIGGRLGVRRTGDEITNTKNVEAFGKNIFDMAKALLIIPIAISMLLLPLSMLGNMDEKVFTRGLTGLEIILLTLVFVMAALGYALSGNDQKAISAMSKLLITIVLCVSALTLIMKVLGEYMSEEPADGNYFNTNFTKMLVGFVTIEAILWTMIGAVSVLSKFSKKSLIYASASMAIVAGAIGILLAELVAFSMMMDQLDIGNVWQSLAIMVLMITAITAAITVVGKFVTAGGKKILYIGEAFILIASGIAIMALSLMALGMIELPTNNLIAILGVTLLAAAYMFTIAKFTNRQNKTMKNIANTFVIMAGGIAIIALSLLALAQKPIPIQNLLTLLAVIGEVVGWFTYVAKKVTGGTTGDAKFLSIAKSFVIMASGIAIIAASLELLAIAPAYWRNLGTLIVVIAELGVFFAIVSKITPSSDTSSKKFIALAKSFVIMAAGVAIIAASLVALAILPLPVQNIVAICFIIGELALFLYIFSKNITGAAADAKKFYAVATSFVIMAAGVLIMAVGLTILGLVELPVQNIGAILGVILAVGIWFYLFTKNITIDTGKMLATAASFVIMAAGVLVMAAALMVLGQVELSWSDVAGIVLTILAVGGVLLALTKLTDVGDLFATSVAFLVASLAVAALMLALKELGKVGADNESGANVIWTVTKAVIALIAVIGVLLALFAALSAYLPGFSAGLLVAAVCFAIVGLSCLAVAAAIWLILQTLIDLDDNWDKIESGLDKVTHYIETHTEQWEGILTNMFASVLAGAAGMFGTMGEYVKSFWEFSDVEGNTLTQKFINSRASMKALENQKNTDLRNLAAHYRTNGGSGEIMSRANAVAALSDWLNANPNWKFLTQAELPEVFKMLNLDSSKIEERNEFLSRYLEAGGSLYADGEMHNAGDLELTDRAIMIDKNGNLYMTDTVDRELNRHKAKEQYGNNKPSQYLVDWMNDYASHEGGKVNSANTTYTSHRGQLYTPGGDKKYIVTDKYGTGGQWEDVSAGAGALGDGVDLLADSVDTNTKAVEQNTQSVEQTQNAYGMSKAAEYAAEAKQKDPSLVVSKSLTSEESYTRAWYSGNVIGAFFTEGFNSFLTENLGLPEGFSNNLTNGFKKGADVVTSGIKTLGNSAKDALSSLGIDVDWSKAGSTVVDTVASYFGIDTQSEAYKKFKEKLSFDELKTTIKNFSQDVFANISEGKDPLTAIKDAWKKNNPLGEDNIVDFLFGDVTEGLFGDFGNLDDYTNFLSEHLKPEDLINVDTENMLDGIKDQMGLGDDGALPEGIKDGFDDSFKDMSFDSDAILDKWGMDPNAMYGSGYDIGEAQGLGQIDGYDEAMKNLDTSDLSSKYDLSSTGVGSSSSSGSNLVWRGYDEKEGRDLYAPAMEEFRNTLVTPIREGWIWNGWNRKSKSDPLWLPDEKTQAKMDALKKTAEAVKESTDSTAASFEERSKSLKAEGKLLDGIDKESKWLFDENTMEWTLVDKNGKPITKEDMEGNVSNVTKAGTKIGSKYGVNDSILKNGVWVYDEKNDEWTLFDSKTNKEMLTKTGDEGFIVTRKNPELKKSEYAVLKNREDLDMTKGVRKFDYKDSAGLPQKIQDNKGHIYDAYGRKVKGYDNRYALTDKNGNLITGKNGNRIEFEVADDGTLRVLGEYNESAQIMKETAQTCVGLMSMGLGAIAKAFADNPEAAAALLKNDTTSDAVNTAAYATGNAETTETTTQYSSVQNGDATTTTTTNAKTSTASTSTTSQQTTQDAATVADRALSNLRSMNQTLVQIKGKIDMMQENIRSTNDNTRFINNQLIEISKSESPVILDTQALVGRLLPLINQGLGQYTSLGSRRVTT